MVTGVEESDDDGDEFDWDRSATRCSIVGFAVGLILVAFGIGSTLRPVEFVGQVVVLGAIVAITWFGFVDPGPDPAAGTAEPTNGP